ncbi:Nei endonuclease VIII-like 1 [Mactra antiquata]
MPEGPELHLASRFINRVCSGRVFNKILKSEISKNPIVHPPADRFRISATSRGKEIKLTLTDAGDAGATNGKKKAVNPSVLRTLDIVFTFGLAGKFEFCQQELLHKHAHLKFYTNDGQSDMVLSFVDYMRFGKWTPNADFSFKDRGPCVLTDYDNFRSHVLQNIESSTVFNKPICEVLLNQKYFNGIGNYLRAEILHRLNIPPFVSAKSVLQPLVDSMDVKTEFPDILQLCHRIPNEVIVLESSWYDGEDRSDETNVFNQWLQCYYQDGMKNMVDHNKRTIWFSGPAGPLAPKEGQTRGKKRTKSKKKSVQSSDATVESDVNETLTNKNCKADDDTKVSKPKKSRRHVTQAVNNHTEEGARLTRGKMKEIIKEIDNISDNHVAMKKKNEKSRKRKQKSKGAVNEEKNDDTSETTSIVNGKLDEMEDLAKRSNISIKYKSVGRKRKNSLKTPKKA